MAASEQARIERERSRSEEKDRGADHHDQDRRQFGFKQVESRMRKPGKRNASAAHSGNNSSCRSQKSDQEQNTADHLQGADDPCPKHLITMFAQVEASL